MLSILIGVNDYWHMRNGDYGGTVETYERDYDALLERTRRALPNVELVLCEPFILRCGAVDESWIPGFDEFRAAARRVAQAHTAAWVPFQEMFDQAVRYAPPEHWAADGVHPSPAAATLMAQTWLRAIGEEPLAYLEHRVRLALSILGILPGVPVQKIEFRDHFDYRGSTVFALPHARAAVAFFECGIDILFHTGRFQYFGFLFIGIG